MRSTWCAAATATRTTPGTAPRSPPPTNARSISVTPTRSGTRGCVRSRPTGGSGGGGWKPFDALEMPEVVESGGRRFEVIPTPGHARTQVALYERATGDVFTGDLVISPGAAAVLTWSNPWQEAESLRRVAALRTAADVDRPRSDRGGSRASPRAQGRAHRRGSPEIGRADVPGRCPPRCRQQGLPEGSIQRPLLRVADEPRVLTFELRPRRRPPCTRKGRRLSRRCRHAAPATMVFNAKCGIYPASRSSPPQPPPKPIA